MDNQQLMSLFQEIYKQKNCFDQLELLKKYNKQYKKSSFYKNTRMSINKAYIMFQANGLLKLIGFLNSPMIQDIFEGDTMLLRIQIQEFLMNFDTSSLDPILDYITDKISNLAMDASGDLGSLKAVVNQFLNSTKKN